MSYLESVNPVHLSPDTSKTGKDNPGINFMERDSKKDLKALQYYEVARTSGSPNLQVTKTQQFKTVLPISAELPDLIGFSDADLLAVDELGEWIINCLGAQRFSAEFQN